MRIWLSDLGFKTPDNHKIAINGYNTFNSLLLSTSNLFFINSSDLKVKEAANAAEFQKSKYGKNF